MKNKKQNGSALLISLMAIIAIASFGLVFFMVNTSSAATAKRSKNDTRLAYAVEAGASEALAELRAGGDGNLQGQISGVTYTVVATNLADGNIQLMASANDNGQQRQLEVIAQGSTGGIFWNAIFAGNKGQDPNYNMPFAGVGTQGDEITGDVYSGQDLSVIDDAGITGAVTVQGEATGVAYSIGTQPIPDLAAMGYEVNHDVNVAEEFTNYGSYTYDDAGGNAFQVPQANLAHIFRKNPSDRSSETSSTAKDDYFLEDPYEPVHSDPNQNGSDAYHIGLNDTADPATDGTQKVYFIDGNLWIHNKHTYSFKFFHSQTDGIQVTFVVKGNIYISDNLFLLNQNKDGILFIAMEDQNVENSGNIYIGDPVFGTVKEMNAFLYADNDFIDTNLDENGSYQFEINGIMSGGNQVNINRDFLTPPGWEWVKVKGKWYKVWNPGEWDHSKMSVTLDERVMDGTLDLPGLPVMQGQAGTYNVISWRPL